jgi:hypothetical protein
MLFGDEVNAFLRCQWALRALGMHRDLPSHSKADCLRAFLMV